MCGLLTLVVPKARTTMLQIYSTQTMCFPCKFVYWIIYNLNSFPVLFICWLYVMYVNVHKTIFCYFFYFFALLIHNGCHFPSFTVSLVFVVGWWVCYWIYKQSTTRYANISKQQGLDLYFFIFSLLSICQSKKSNLFRRFFSSIFHHTLLSIFNALQDVKRETNIEWFENNQFK